MVEFGGKVVLVTGAANGIGFAAARLFAERGAQVVLADIDREAGERALSTLQMSGAEAVFVPMDVSDATDVDRAVDRAIEHFGKLDCAFNNAGIVDSQDSAWDEQAFERTLDINLKGVMLCMRAELRHMTATGKGAIVNTSSIAGMVASAAQCLPAYIASKHAVIGITKAAALQHARNGVRVNAIMPGITMTEILKVTWTPDQQETMQSFSPMGRLAKPEEVAEAALWLCSDRASFVTGHALAVDGGFLAQ